VHDQDQPQVNNVRPNVIDINNPPNGVHVLNMGQRLEDHPFVNGIGLRADLASLLAFPNRANHPLPSIHQTTTVKANVNLNKDSIQFIRDEHNPNLYRVQFLYDSYAPCDIKMYFLAKESLGIIQARTELPSVRCDKGFGVLFSQPKDQGFDVSLCKPEELTATAASSYFPVIISIHSLPEEPVKGDSTKSVILNQTTFATLLHCADDSYAIKVVKQKLPYLGQIYNLHDIYGLDYTGERESEGSRECVVCLSEPRDTTILPCNHLCLCAGCAEVMRTQTNKCPICRAPVKKLLSIRLSSASDINNNEMLPTHLEGAKLNENIDETDEEGEGKLLSKRDKEKGKQERSL